MHSDATGIAVVGHSSRTGPIVASLRSAGFYCQALTPRTARASPGVFLGSAMIVWAFQPTLQRLLEAEGYASGAVALYAYWDAKAGCVGPILSPEVGPCPRCVSGVPVSSGTDSLLQQWVAACVALQCDALLRVESSELLGACVMWNLSSPGLQHRALPESCHCACVANSALAMPSDHL